MPTFTVKEKVAKKSRLENPQTMEDADAILLQAVVKFKELRALKAFKMKEIDDAMQAPRLIIERALDGVPDRTIVTPDFKISMTPSTTECLDKDAVIEKFGRGKLKQFLSTKTTYPLRVS